MNAAVVAGEGLTCSPLPNILNFSTGSSGGRFSVHHRMPPKFPICISNPRSIIFYYLKFKMAVMKTKHRVVSFIHPLI